MLSLLLLLLLRWWEWKEAGADDDDLDQGAEKVVMVANGTTSRTPQYGIGGRRSSRTLMRGLPSGADCLRKPGSRTRRLPGAERA
jgi:hypothetical protein